MVNENKLADALKLNNELLLTLNDLIEKTERQIMNYFSDNVKQEDMHGEIELPLVFNENSDYAKLRELTKGIKVEMDKIDRVIDDPRKYLLGELEGRFKLSRTTNEEKEKLLEKEVENLKEKRKTYEDRLRLISEDPKNYVRLQECRNSNFSKVEDPEVRKNLEEMQKSLDGYKHNRSDISNIIKIQEGQLLQMSEDLEGPSLK